MIKDTRDKIYYKKPWFELCFDSCININIRIIDSYDNDDEYNDKLTILKECKELQDYIEVCKQNNIDCKYNKFTGYIVYD